MVQLYSPAIMILTETKIRGPRAKAISNRLPFDGAIHTKTIGLARGLWVLWDSSQVEVLELASTEQEIHAIVKVISSNFSWVLFAIYASPRYAERCLLWNNLTTVASLHSLP